MSAITGRLRREHETLVCMTGMYCKHHHFDRKDAGLCPECAKLMQYAEKRLDKCPYGPDKPTCANCPIHCYKPAQREMTREIMRFAGPRMTCRHPWRALHHLFDKFRRVEHPMKLRAELRRRRAAGGQERARASRPAR